LDTSTTKAAIRQDGWFYTVDVGVMHPDGYLEIRDRSKDVIISGGENISSVEVESVLYGHPAVNEAAVVRGRMSSGVRRLAHSSASGRGIGAS
jgi:acyl-CoA synthetase (AMP-forming)/AMP-acid ligase II